MKNTAKILYLMLGVCICMFVGCSDDNPERTPSPEPNSMQVYFPTQKSTVEVEPDANSFSITIARVNTASAASVGLTKTVGSDAFVVPQTVEFAAGVSEVTITITFSGLEAFEKYALELQLDEKYTNPYKPVDQNGDGKDDNVTTGLRINLTQSDWADYKSGTFYSEFFEEEWPQTLQFSEILGQYRFPDVYAEGYAIIFTIKEDGSITYSKQQTGFVDSRYGMISIQMPAETSDDQPFKDGNTINLWGEFTVSAGSFGTALEIFEFD